MLIKSQCGNAVFNSEYLVGMWLKTYDEKTFMIKAIFGKQDAILGTYDSKEKAQNHFDNLLEKFKTKSPVYQI